MIKILLGLLLSMPSICGAQAFSGQDPAPAAVDSTKVAKTGDGMSGPLTLSGSSLTVTGGASISTSATAAPAIATDSNGLVKVSAGGISTAAVGGVIYVESYLNAVTTTVGNAGWASFTEFSTITIKADVLKRNGDSIRYRYSGAFVRDAANVFTQFEVLMNGVVISSWAGNATAWTATDPPQTWQIEQIIQRVGVGAQFASCVAGAFQSCNIAPGRILGIKTTADETAPINFVVRARSANTNAGAVDYWGARFYYEPAP